MGGGQEATFFLSTMSSYSLSFLFPMLQWGYLFNATEEEVVDAKIAAIRCALTFSGLSVEEMATLYAKRPDRRVWKAIAVLTSPSTLLAAEARGTELLLSFEDDEEERHRRYR